MRQLIAHLRRHPRDIPFIAALLATFFIVPLTVVTVVAQTAPRITSGPAVAESDITETSALVTWGTDIASTTVVQFGKTRELGQEYKKIVPLEETEVTETSHSMTLWSLEPGTEYFYRVRSVSGSGGTVVSDIASFFTAKPVFTGTPLRGVTLSAPPAGTVSEDGLVSARVDIDGKADSVSVSFAPVSGGDAKRVDAAEAGGGWLAPPTTLANGEWTITATANGSASDGTPLTLSSVPGSVTVLIPEPEPVAEPETGPEPETVTTPEPEPVAVPVREPEQVESTANESEPTAVEERAEETSMPTMKRSVIAPATSGKKATVIEYSEEKPEGATEEGHHMSVTMRPYSGGTGGAQVPDSVIDRVDAFMEVAVAAADEQGRVTVNDDVEASADDVIEQGVTDNVFVALPGGLSSVSDSAAENARWWPSVKEQGVAPAMAVVDTDQDGLPDDYEKAQGTDPNAADTDGDGVSDIEELQRGDNPRGEGKLDRELDPTEKTVVFQKALAQPSSKDDVDEDFQIVVDHVDGQDASGAPTSEATGTLSGRCDPKATCILYVYSYVPMVLTTTTADDGSWSYDLADSVTGGEHTVYVAVTDDTGKITRRSNPLSFIVPEARAITVDEALAATAEQLANVTSGSTEDVQRNYLYGTALVIVLGIVIAGAVLLRPQRRKEKTPDGP